MRTSSRTPEPALHHQAQLGEALASRAPKKRRSSRLRAETSNHRTVVAEHPPGRHRDATVNELGCRLHELNIQADETRSGFFAAIVQFDDLEGWRSSGSRNCVRWMIDVLGLGRSRAYEQYKTAKELHALPTIADGFATGKLNWCKVRALLRVATPQDEQALMIAALDLTPDEVQRLCDDYRFGKDPGSDAERDKAQRARRSLTWKTQADGSITMQIVLPPESGADVIRCLEHREELLFGGSSDKNDSVVEPRPSAQQRRADSLVAMAHASIGGAVEGANSSAKADRHLVVAHIDLEALEAAEYLVASESQQSDAPLPTPVRAAIAGILGGSISPATVRRLACEGSLVTMIMKGGEPVAVGRRHRLHTAAQRRAILARDGGCTFPGCGATRHLDIHHTTLWRDGGKTSVRDGATLCSACHKRVHDEGWRITRVPDDAPIVRNPDAQALLDGADEHTKSITRRLDTRRSVFRFERSEASGNVDRDQLAPAESAVGSDLEYPHRIEVSSASSCCKEPRGPYRIRGVARSRRVSADVVEKAVTIRGRLWRLASPRAPAPCC